MGLKIANWLVLASVAVAAAFTPEQLISAPRRSEAVPNPSGKTAIFSVSEYSFSSHSGSSAWKALDTSSGKTTLLSNSSDVSEVVWIDDKTLLYLNGSNAAVAGGVELWVTTLAGFEADAYRAASIPGPLANLKIAPPSSKGKGIRFLLTGKQTLEGKIYNAETEDAPLSTAHVYDQIYIRHWDTWLTPETYTLFSGVLSGGKRTKYSFNGELTNLLAGVKGLETPVQPFGGTGDFSITPDGSTVAFMSKDPDLPLANFTASYVYLVPSDGSEKPKALNAPTSPGTPKNARGASAAPTFSPDGKSIAYLQMDDRMYESDRNQVYISKLGSGKISALTTKWDRSPSGIIFAPNGKTLYLLTEDTGREKIFTLPLPASAASTPKALTHEGYVSAAYPISSGSSLLISNSSMISSTSYSTVSTSTGAIKRLLEANKVDANLHGLADNQVSEFWYQGNWTQIHGWLVKPINFDPSKKYPLAFLIHGGPQGSWANNWSNRWNPAVFANQGYVVALINPTGSTGYGAKLTDAIQNNWGGAPYSDLALGFAHLKASFPFIDTTRAVAAGASYGGYMVNWIQGHPLGREFRALVTHDGVFSTLNQYASEELWFMQHDFNGTFWADNENYARWDPAKPELIAQWATPHLVVHNDLDYRLPVSEGVALFNVLQERGVESRFLGFPDENHWVLGKENSRVWHKEVLGWLNKYSGVAGDDEL
ncbi:dipeptidyl-peptidase [Geopyxis carbonaria]|nr:dipeptidyl-peptidase [Geopyxis carbonaria]